MTPIYITIFTNNFVTIFFLNVAQLSNFLSIKILLDIHSIVVQYSTSRLVKMVSNLTRSFSFSLVRLFVSNPQLKAVQQVACRTGAFIPPPKVCFRHHETLLKFQYRRIREAIFNISIRQFYTCMY